MAGIGKILRNLRRRKQFEEDLDREMASCVDILAAEKEKSGLSAQKARRQATLETGGVQQNKEAVRDVRSGARIALGARRRDILFLSLAQSARLAAVGLGIGLSASVGLAQLMSSRLYGVVPVDWTTFAGVTLLLGGCVLLATLIPAHRASRVDPMMALRHE